MNQEPSRINSSIAHSSIRPPKCMTGANYRSPEMEVPDTMDVSMILNERLLFTRNSMFGNSYYGEGDDLVPGDKGTIHRNPEERVGY